jgi:dipeptidyl aminopeptidase/acylaminoacyl peptidase
LKVLPPADASKIEGALPVTSDKPAADSKVEPLPLEITTFEIAPDGKAIALIANDPKTPGEKKQADAKADADWVNHEIHGSRLYLFDLASTKLTAVPIPPDIRSASWSPDSTRLVVLGEEQNGISDLRPAGRAWTVMAGQPDSSSPLEKLPHTATGALWSHDGNFVVFEAQAAQESPPGYRDVFRYKLKDQSVGNLTSQLNDCTVNGRPIALSNGDLLLPIGTGVHVGASLFSASDSKAAPLSFPVRVVRSLTPNAAENAWVFLGSSSTQPEALYYSTSLHEPPRVLSLPALLPPDLQSSPVKRLHWKNGTQDVEGLLYLPPQAENTKVSLVVEVHGGPLGAYVDDYAVWINFLVGQGWAVLRTNPRGSTNYGPAFAAANKNDLGGGDYTDIMAGLDHVLKTENIDPDRLALEGYSYGGEMAGFVEGKTDRFKAIVSGAPVIDQYSEYGTEGNSWSDRWYFGRPWEHPGDAWRQSPLAGVAHAKTPFLLLQGDADTTDPLGQAQEMYRALRQAGVPVELIRYPRENHGPLASAIYGRPTVEPWHGFDARRRIVEFIRTAFREIRK